MLVLLVFVGEPTIADISEQILTNDQLAITNEGDGWLYMAKATVTIFNCGRDPLAVPYDLA
jgi:hypothetical protein